MKSFISFWVVSLPIMILLDMVWFSISLERLYKPYIGHVMTGNFNYLVAAVFYLLYSAGLSYLILLPGLESNQTLLKIVINGFFFGLVAYGAYDLTNQATVKDWPVIVTIVDMLWGALVTAVVSAISYKVILFISK